MLTNSLRQTIGDYDIQISTNPNVPVAGREATINLKFSTVSNIPVTDTPILIRIDKDNNQLMMTDPIFLPSGHYQLPYVFKTSGIYSLNIDILVNGILGDVSSNEQSTFEFPIRVSDLVTLYLTSLIVPVGISTLLAAIVAVILRKYKYKLKYLKFRIRQ